MSVVLALANQKGGVGKTTSAVNISAALGALGKKVLLIDADPQGNASSAVGINKKNMNLSTYDVLIGRASAENVITETEFANLSIIPTKIDLAGAEFELVNTEDRAMRLSNALSTVKEQKQFDYIIIDSPPSLGMLTINVLAAADGVIIPMDCQYFALEGLSQLFVTIKQIQRLYNPTLTITGILMTMYVGRYNISQQVMDELKQYYAKNLFSTMIPRNVSLLEAPGFGKPIHYYEKNSKGALAYKAVAEEIIERIEKQ